MKRITAVIIARNEEANLPRCLASIKWTDEIILVDSGSIDRTREIATLAGARVIDTEWKGFGHSKQTGLDRATGEWVFSIDADEEVTEDLAREIKRAVADPGDRVGYYVPRLTQFLGRWIRHGGWYPDYVLRLFRRDSGSISDNVVHESVIATGPTGRLKHDMLHYCYPSLDVYFDKMNRYTSLAAAELHAAGRRAGLLRLLANPLAKFVKQYLLRAGLLDGREGLTLALLSAGYVFTKYAKLIDLNRAPRKDGLPE